MCPERLKLDSWIETIGKPFSDPAVQSILKALRITDIPPTPAPQHVLFQYAQGVELLFAGPDFTEAPKALTLPEQLLVCVMVYAQKDYSFKPWRGETLWKGVSVQARRQEVVAVLGPPESEVLIDPDQSRSVKMLWRHGDNHLMQFLFDGQGHIHSFSVALTAWSQRASLDLLRFFKGMA